MASSSDENGENLPHGFKFKPTDFELLVYYLIPRLVNEELPVNIVTDCDVFRYDPHELPMNQFKCALKNQAHFFTEDKWESHHQVVRITPNGSWKVYREDPISCTCSGFMGSKAKLFFHDSEGKKTNWKMTEYRCHPDKIPSRASNMKNYMVCKVKRKELREASPEEDILSTS